MQNNTQVHCPNCGNTIDVQDIIAHQLEEEIKKKYQSELETHKKRLENEQNNLLQAQKEFEEKKKQENLIFQQKLETKLRDEKILLETSIKQKLENEQSERLRIMREELDNKTDQIKDLNKTKAEIESLRREKETLKESIEADLARKMSEQMQTEREKIRKLEEEKNDLKIRELMIKLEDQKKLTEEMKRKQEQGSMQLQGEVQELAIEEWLNNNFPLDTIEEIKKGARGGDCIQIVNTHTRQNCGKIYYESKRTKDFQPSWIEKFKADMREKEADIGVLVTDALPVGFDRIGNKDGVWVCTFEEFKGLCSVLREFVIQISQAIASQENKGDKMHLLYDYLTSNTFRMQIEAIVEGFSSMKNELDKEKRAMSRIWKEREKQIEKVITNTIDMYGSIRGIAGNAVKPVQALELSFEADEFLEE